jgi:hypothetical protein
VSERYRILDFDLENRPLSYLGSDYTTGDITAIAASWLDEEEVHVWVQTKDDRSRRRMLKGFKALYDQADMVTGHFIRGYDLPVINGALMEEQLALLGDKMTCDTKQDLKKRKYISASQENLAAMLGIDEPKVQMNTPKWRQANRLTVAGIELTKLRCVGDVVQHKAMRARMLELDMLGGPKVWRAGGLKDGEYVP